MPITINAQATTGLITTSDGSGIVKLQSNGVTTNSLAWTNFDGTLSSAISPIIGYNVSSITKTATGRWTVNFTNALSSSTNVFAGTNTNSSSSETPLWIVSNGTSSCNVLKNLNSGGGYDVAGISVVVFGN